MAIFAEQAGNSSLPLNNDYTDAAQQVQMNCGPTFVQAAAVSTGAATAAALPGFVGLSMTVLVILMTTLV